MNETTHHPHPAAVRRLARRALEEDRARFDVTTLALVPPDQQGAGSFLVKNDGVICGLEVARAAFRQLSSEVTMELEAADGSAVTAGHIVATVEGPLAAILSAERVALNFLQRLSGIATLTRRFVDRAADGGPAEVMDTRKTTPGLRELERYAVRIGGGRNHRNTLEDGVLIKDNHIAAAARRGLGVVELVAEARRRAAHTLRVEIEVADPAMALLAFAAEPDVMLLDNMTPAEMAHVVEAAPDGMVLEASGGVTLDNIRAVAATGVQLVSVGALTHSAPALDISLDVSVA